MIKDVPNEIIGLCRKYYNAGYPLEFLLRDFHPTCGEINELDLYLYKKDLKTLIEETWVAVTKGETTTLKQSKKFDNFLAWWNKCNAKLQEAM